MQAQLAHLVFRTRRYQEMVAWYSEFFDAETQYANDSLTFLTYDDEHHRFAIANLDAMGVPKPEGAARDSVGLDHAAFTLPGVGTLLDQYEKQKARGVTPYWCVHHGLTLSMYYRDPDGNGVELQVDRFSSKAEANAYIRGENFGDNPVGKKYDPEELLRRFREGETEELLLDPQNLPG